jgi:two-component system, OmpR family, sensor histidine kinase ChvG
MGRSAEPGARPRKPFEPLLPRRRRFSALTRRILFFNLFALLILIGGVIWVQASRAGLVDERISGIREQGLIVAGALAEYAADPEKRTLNVSVAEPLLSRLIAPTQLRARVYGTNGRLLIDSRNLLARNVVTTTELPPPDWWDNFMQFLNRVYDGAMGVRPLSPLEPYFEAGKDGRVYEEVNSALAGNTEGKVRVNEQDKLVVSVAVPIKRFVTLYGVLMLTTESGDIDNILKEERKALLEVFLVAFVALLFSSLYLAGFIAEPVRRLAAAAEKVRRGRTGREEIPPIEGHKDEIGELGDSLAAMTRALYDRIDANESFAADVAHELKNPLTSLKSAVEVLMRTKDPEAREKLVAVVRNDVLRIDRLITDISDASRLDAELSREKSAPVDIGHLLETVVDIYRGMQLPRGIRIDLALDLGHGGRTIVQGLDERLGQVFRNLIDNAISFSPQGGVVHVAVETLNGRLRARVEDDGPGIPPENLEHIFDRFYTERPPEQGFGKNSGLGLAIARQIVASHGGRIWAENRTDASGKQLGARFVVELPRARESQ